MERRSFIRNSSTVTVAVCTCGMGLSSCSAITGISNVPEAPDGSFEKNGNQVVLKLDKIPELKNAGGNIKFSIPRSPDKPLKLLVARMGDGRYLAVQNRCTHGKRELEYILEKDMIECVSFSHSKYNLQGEVINGPAPEPLTLYEAVQEQDSLIITLG
jgi:nitrite reductase/ring-hydroxylating ferredoxin subunit